MSAIDTTAALQMSAFVLLMTASASFLALTVIRRVRHEMVLRRRFAGKASVTGLLALLIVAAAHSGPAQAQDLQLASAGAAAGFQQMDMIDTPDFGLVEDGSAPTLLIAGLNSDPAEVTSVEQTHLEACYTTARASAQGGGYHDDSNGVLTLRSQNNTVDAFYAMQRQRQQFDDCARQ